MAACLFQPISWRMAAILGNSAVALVARTRPRTSNTASHDNHEKVYSWVSVSFLYEYGAPLRGLSNRSDPGVDVRWESCGTFGKKVS